MSEETLSLSYGTLEATIALFKAVSKYNPNINDFKSTYPKICDVKSEYAISFAEKCRWITIKENAIILTPQAKSYLEHPDEYTFRYMIRDYIIRLRPYWIGAIIRGRESCFQAMNLNERDCFYNAQLSDDSSAVAKWWTDISNETRELNHLELIDRGFKGEELTIIYEEKRIGKKPIWHSIDSSIDGYDILSDVSSEDTQRLLIEVKSSELPLKDAKAHISKKEWKVAASSKNYQFYFWLITGSINKLAILTAEDLAPHMSIDKGKGEWESVSIEFNQFKNMFSIVDSL